jgi:hypothetical protein
MLCSVQVITTTRQKWSKHACTNREVKTIQDKLKMFPFSSQICRGMCDKTSEPNEDQVVEKKKLRR